MERTINGEFIKSTPHKGQIIVRVEIVGQGNYRLNLDPYEARRLGVKLISDAVLCEQDMRTDFAAVSDGAVNQVSPRD